MSGLFGEEELHILEGRANIYLLAPTFSSIPPLLVGSPAIAFLHRNLAVAAAARLPLAIQPLPFKSPAFSDVVMCHPSHAKDKGLLWLIDQFLSAAKDLRAGEGGRPTAQNGAP
jgi:DNA-binding transcriptional LysR family regulator